jgi:antibiotic biosynthesis monooxygenase (ABM) superfamily enzyme
MTFGLTIGHFSYHAASSVRSYEDRAAGRACATLDVDVQLSMQPVTVYLAQELDASPCARRMTLDHELKHVAVFRDTLDEASRDLAAELPGVLGAGIERGASAADIQRRAQAKVDGFLAAFHESRQKLLEERQNAIDSPEEHRRVKDACPG